MFAPTLLNIKIIFNRKGLKIKTCYIKKFIDNFHQAKLFVKYILQFS